MRIVMRLLPAVAACAWIMASIGCASNPPVLSGHGVVFYCDGAGGDGIANWGPGVRKGLKEAGFTGTFEEFPWETGLGVIVDQTEAVSAKRAQARKLAGQIADYVSAHPGSPVAIMGLSAGTAIVPFALEALPNAVSVDTAVLLSGSLSSGYNLTEALRHIRGDMYVTTSPNDAILIDAVPLTGSADDKKVGDDVVGVDGCHLPPGASPETRRLYSKIMIIRWDPSFLKYGDAGGHTDTTNPAFVRHVIAPLIIREGPRYMQVHPNGSAGMMR